MNYEEYLGGSYDVTSGEFNPDKAKEKIKKEQDIPLGWKKGRILIKKSC